MAKRLFNPFRVCVLCVFLTLISIASAQTEIPQQVLDWQKAAQESITQKNLAAAIESYQLIADSFPNSVYAYDAWVQIARLNVQTQNIAQVQSAATQLCTVYRDQPGMFRAVFNLVKDYMHAQKDAQALWICNEAQKQLSSHPRAAMITGWLGMVYAHQGNTPQAQQMIKALLEGNLAPSDFLDGMCNIGWGYYCADQWDQAIAIYRQGIKYYPDDKQAAYLQYHIVQTCLKKGDIEAVRTEMETLKRQFGKHNNTAGLICRLADQQYDMIRKNLWVGNFNTANLWTELFLTQFRQCDSATSLAFRLAQEYRKKGQQQQAIEIYKKLLVQFSSHKDIAGVQDALVETYADLGDLAKAQEAVKIDIEKYPQRRELLRMITRVAIETARAGDPNNAMELTQAIFDQKPQGTDQLFGYTTLARVYVHQGKDVEAETIVDKSLEQFKAYPGDLAYHLFGVGEEYYYRGGKLLTLNDLAGAKIATQKAINLWQRPVISSNPGIPHMLVTCYQWLGQPELSTAFYNKTLLVNPSAGANENPPLQLAGDRYCGAYAVWHLLKYYGKTVTIDSISDQMKISAKGYATIQDIVDTLKTHELSARPTRVQTDKTYQINTPFIQYLIPLADNSLGHFVLCLPTGTGKVAVLDGMKVPYIADLTQYQSSESFWDGTIILIQDNREDYLERIISRQLLWNTGLVASFCWLQDDSTECFLQTKDYYSRLLDQQLGNLRGGCDLDCKAAGKNCYIRQECTRDNDCYGLLYACNDETEEETCRQSGSWGIPCTYDSAHNCGPKYKIAPKCGGTRCMLGQYLNDLCTGMTREWIHQCHDGW